MVREKVFLVQIFLLLTISVFADAKPKNQNFWKEFSEISKIYRPSKGEQKVAKYILNKGLSKGFKSYIDKSGNVLIEVPATSGSENLPGIILQSHMDMVCIAKKDSNFEWGKNQIEIYEDKGWLCSKNTTLGADNGVGVAAMLDVLNSPPKEHGPLQLLFTVDEEGDFTGVCSLQAKQLKGKFLLNLDSEEAGEFNIGCAGGQLDILEIPITKEKLHPQEKAFEISISNGLGGHSGVDVHLKRANAITELFKLLQRVRRIIDIKLVSCSGGTSDTAIPSSAEATIAFDQKNEQQLSLMLRSCFKVIKSRFLKTDKDLKISCVPITSASESLSQECSDQLIHCFSDIPSGILLMSKTWPGNVQTSMNPGLIEKKKNSIRLKVHIQATTLTCISHLSRKLNRVADCFGAKHIKGTPYRPWEADKDSKLISESTKIHEKVLGFSPKLKVVHAGIECGELKNICPEIKMISFGPDIKHAHTISEKVKIGTVDNFLNLLRAMIVEIPKALEQESD